MPRAFVIRGFGKHRDSSGNEIDFDRVDADLITPAIERCNLVGGTTGQIVEAGNIRVDMFALIVEADVVICDVTVHNANVFYELGIRHAMRKKHTILIKGDPTQDKTPFDLLTDRYLKYPIENPGSALDNLVDAIHASVNGHRETDSPVFQMLPTLPETDTNEICVSPIEVGEEVGCAEAAADKGWLRLLADELEGERFEMSALERVARAQWALGDYDGARKNWETLKNARPDDVEPNLALANIYERISHKTSQARLLEASNQCIRSVLANTRTPLPERAEALALHGRNLKTLWRVEFRDAATREERRTRALDGKLRESFEAYRRAFYVDLNSFYPGIAALQMGTILRSFADDPAWSDLFEGNETEARRYKEDLDTQLPSLRHIVQVSAANAKERETGDDRMWAAITAADLLFLSRPDVLDAADVRRVTQAYRDAIPANKRFAWDATKGQLKLFADLGIKAELAAEVIDKLDSRFETETVKPVHLVVFSGHTVDTAQSPQPRFPADKEAQAKALIEAKINALQKPDEEMVILASAAPGADILAHEVCQHLGVRRVLCLPMPNDVVVGETFNGYDDAWRERFFAVVNASEGATLVLGNSAGLPRWLRRKNASVWERGNKWVMRLAQSWGAKRVTLLAMWDGTDTGESSAGTAYMVKLARDSGAFALESIDTKQLI
ncbi:tetratricopeptide repeat-containing protein [Paraburkholderia hospita]|jgi:tetratricopeptide (TPR) repeat protein|uniref:DUF4071 domain-containing protein n=1 Tax=Paraburkholderia hospita TaxID=169430 RepID=A0AAJ4STY5_9BURK|nr:tetratricopeptide repeat-containing protein [Paraburkholderia hospita]SKD01691.1 hypothetical protein SAMN05445504_8469 [Burkholderia sp. CF099]AUT74388.1 hypothetical protein C2L64_39745 [Paraburkholderia hospita]AXF04020.1 hypothetical protein CUJ88_36725 [Paraburkholderia hospita]EIM99300.1 hypothetical protein WQE_19379 [Paraburkholderia hospita]OUL78271.1 hypothetical protein CA601_36515 [Paraburkholderia hospita]